MLNPGPGRPLVSIIIPCYNDEQVLWQNLPVLDSFLKLHKFTYEILICDDGSKEPISLNEAANYPELIILRSNINKGKGAAVKNGMLNAKGEYLFFTDCDIPFETEVILQMIEYLKVKEFNLVVGDRTLPGSQYFNEIKKRRKWSSKLFNRLVGNFVAGGWYDTQCGLKAFTYKTAQELFSVSRINGFAFDVEILYLALKRNYDIKRLPVQMRSNQGSSVSLLRHGFQMFIDVFKVIYGYYNGKYEGFNSRP